MDFLVKYTVLIYNNILVHFVHWYVFFFFWSFSLILQNLTHLSFPLLIFDPLQDVVNDATSGGVVEKCIFVVDDETGVKQTG